MQRNKRMLDTENKAEYNNSAQKISRSSQAKTRTSLTFHHKNIKIVFMHIVDKKMEVDVEIKMEVIMCEVSLLVLRSLWFLMSPVFFFFFFFKHEETESRGVRCV